MLAMQAVTSITMSQGSFGAKRFRQCGSSCSERENVDNGSFIAPQRDVLIEEIGLCPFAPGLCPFVLAAGAVRTVGSFTRDWVKALSGKR